MTMHLARGLTTIRNRKYKPKMTKANIAKWEEGLRLKNKEHKRVFSFLLLFLLGKKKTKKGDSKYKTN